MAGGHVYWISTALLCLLYIASAILYIIRRDWVRRTFAELGYPGYLVTVLTLLKLTAVSTILGRFSAVLSDLAYENLY